MKKALVIYHRADNDGLFSHVIAKAYLQQEGYVVESHGADYADTDLPNEAKLAEYAIVYIVDFAYDILLNKELWGKIIWIDHHKTAIEKYSDEITGLRVDGVAACRLTWFRCFGLKHPEVQGIVNINGLKGAFLKRAFFNEPYCVTIVGEFDIWDHRDPNARLFNLGTSAWSPEDLDGFYHALSTALKGDAKKSSTTSQFTKELIADGKTVEQYQATLNKRAQRGAFKLVSSLGTTLPRITFWAMNAAGNSLAFEGLDMTGIDGLLMYRFSGKGDSDLALVMASNIKVTISLYGPPNRTVDLSEYAKFHGGGGHPGACGFNLNMNSFLAL